MAIRLGDKRMSNAPIEHINGASIDITLDGTVAIEASSTGSSIDIANKENIRMINMDIDNGFILRPNEFILASSKEVFNLPNNIVAEYVLKSSMARNGLNHLFAGFCDPTWSNSKLTLELKNECQYHSLILRAGMKIGQVKFFKVKAVPDENSYTIKGQYNNQKTTQQSKGIR